MDRKKSPPGERLISKARASGPDGMDPRLRFRNVAERRMAAAVGAIRLLGQMAGGNTFDIYLSDVDNLERYIRSELDMAMARLKGEKPRLGSIVWDS